MPLLNPRARPALKYFPGNGGCQALSCLLGNLLVQSFICCLMSPGRVKALEFCGRKKKGPQELMIAEYLKMESQEEGMRGACRMSSKSWWAVDTLQKKREENVAGGMEEDWPGMMCL